ncbi:MAG: DNA adenine methylase [Chloroflexi bacterium]|nr:DNA adenine methylase [Chloroflexota bacterium]
MKQLHLPGIPPPEQIVNVASVKHRSPFRYPGGKTWLVPRIFRWLASLPPSRRKVLLEPFAGGAIVGLSAAFEGWVSHVVLVELDDEVAAVWQTIIEDDAGEWLAERIRTFDLTPDTVDSLLAHPAPSCPERAFQTIVKNRVNRGGILAAGAGRLKHGENGKGLASRWYPATLSQRILDIRAIRQRLTVVHGDGLAVMQHYAKQDDMVLFIDPPYTAGGKKPGTRLYTHATLDHVALFQLGGTVDGDFLMTYSHDEAITRLAQQHNFQWRTVAMKNTHHARQTELLIGRDLAWLDGG